MRYCVFCGNKLVDNNEICPNCNSSNKEEICSNNKNNISMSIIFYIISLILVSPPYISMIVMINNKKIGINEIFSAIVLYEITIGIMINIVAIIFGTQSIKKYKENVLATINIALALIPYLIMIVAFIISLIK